MPLFKDLESLHIVFREHEFNAEVLDGFIEKIDDVDKAVILKHMPNIQWGYDVLVEETGYVDNLWQSWKSKISTKPQTPSLFYNLVLESDIDLYGELNNYKIIKIKVKKEDIKNSKPFANIKMPNKSYPTTTENGENDLPDFRLPDSEVGHFKLLRDGEAPTYKFKSPNSR